jgi:hypothetical protein
MITRYIYKEREDLPLALGEEGLGGKVRYEPFITAVLITNILQKRESKLKVTPTHLT